MVHDIILYKIADNCYSNFGTLEELWILDYVSSTLLKNASTTHRLGSSIATRNAIRLIDEKRKENTRSDAEESSGEAPRQNDVDAISWTGQKKKPARDKLFIDYFLSCEYTEYISAIKIVIHIIDWRT